MKSNNTIPASYYNTFFIYSASKDEYIGEVNSYNKHEAIKAAAIKFNCDTNDLDAFTANDFFC